MRRRSDRGRGRRPHSVPAQSPPRGDLFCLSSFGVGSKKTGLDPILRAPISPAPRPRRMRSSPVFFDPTPKDERRKKKKIPPGWGKRRSRRVAYLISPAEPAGGESPILRAPISPAPRLRRMRSSPVFFDPVPKDERRKG